MGYFEDAMECLEFARNNGVSSKQTKDIQELIATGYAKADGLSADEKKEKVNDYTHGDKWYRYFKSAYLDNW